MHPRLIQRAITPLRVQNVALQKEVLERAGQGLARRQCASRLVATERGADLGDNSDLTALVELFFIQKWLYVRPHFFCPEETFELRVQEGRNNYRDWLARRAQDAPENFQHLQRLVEAERAWVNEDFRAAAIALLSACFPPPRPAVTDDGAAAIRRSLDSWRDD